MNGTPEDNKELRAFLRETESLIDQIVENADWLFPPRFRNPAFLKTVRDAWREVAPDLTRVATELWTSGQQAAGDTAGFRGSQLDFKLKTFELLSGLNAIDRSKKRFWKKVAEWLVKILKQVDTILGSLIKAFSKLEAVKEFKETLENILGCHDLAEDEFNDTT